MNLKDIKKSAVNEVFLQGILNASHEGISILDKHLTVLKVNRTMEQWYSHAMPIVGEKCYSAYQNRSEPCEHCPSLKTIEDKKMHVKVVSLAGANEEARVLELYTYPLIDDSGDVQGVVEFIRDVTEEKKVQGSLKELYQKLSLSEKRWQYALEGAGDGVWDWNIQSGEVFYSRRWKEMLGYGEDEVGNTGSEWTGRIHPDDKRRCYSTMDKHLNGETELYEIEHRLRCKDGHYKWFIDRGKIIEWTDDGKPLRMIGTHSDISGLKQTEEALAGQLQFEKMVADISANFVNTKADEIDDAINYALRLSGQFFNVDRSYVFKFSPDCKIMDNTHEWCAVGVEPQIARLQNVAVDSMPWWARQIRKGEIVNIPDVDALPADAGAEKKEFGRQKIRSLLSIPIIGDGTMIGFLGYDTVKDKKRWTEEQLSLLKVVTEIMSSALSRHRAEEELRRSEENLSITLDSIGDGVIATDTEERITQMNPVAQHLTGWPLEEARGKLLTEVFHIINAQTGKPTENPVKRVLQTGGIVGLANHTALIARDGSTRQIADCASPIRDRRGEPVGVVMVFSDVTEEYALRKELRRIEWMLSPRKPVAGVKEKGSVQQYEELVRLNRSRLILDSVGEDILKDIAGEYVDLLDTATIIFEKDGDYALSAFQSEWCRMLNYASLELCQAEDAGSAIKSGRCLCHESCWTGSAKKAVETGSPVDIECHGGMRIYAIPIKVYGRVEGAISMGYGEPPREPGKLRELSEKYALDYGELEALAKEYESRPPFMIELAKERLHASARLIGTLVESKQAEKARRDSEERYRLIAENTADMITVMDLDFNPTFIGPSVETTLGYSVEEATKLTIKQTLTPESFARAHSIYKGEKALLASGKGDPHRSYLEEFEHYCKDGSTIWAEVRISVMYDEDNNPIGFVSVSRDITERKKAEEARRENEAVKSSIIEATPDMLVRFSSEGRYLEIISGEQNWSNLLSGLPAGISVYDFLPGDVAEQAISCIKKALQKGKLQKLEYRVEHADGMRFREARFKASAKNEVIAFIRDITEEKLVQEALRRSEEKHREILSSIQEGYYESDLSGNLVFFNEATAKMLGYSREELLGMNYRKICKSPDAVQKIFLRIFQAGRPDRGVTLEMIRKDGSISYGELSISLIRDKDGSISGFRGVARDVTMRVEYEEKLRYISMHDQLTGLYNRVFFEEEIRRLSSGEEHPLTIIIADLDDLKLINDSLGHDKGDRLLVKAAGILKKSLRETDTLARVGGDEFVAILPRTEEAEAEEIVSRIRENVQAYNQNNPGLPLGLSVGLATARHEKASFKSVYKKADDLMYRDKLHHSTWARNQTVQALLMALAERDFITEGHAQRLKEYCLKIGEKLKLSSSQMSDLALLAQVHDLGKVGIPDRILLKKKPLTDAEWEIMRMHPDKGYRIALSSTDLAGVADLILKHHERWDGGGYPLGLAGKEIPIECRILAIVDAYDAMTNNRPYSKAVSHESALQELKRCAGTQFDSELVDIFISLFDG